MFDFLQGLPSLDSIDESYRTEGFVYALTSVATLLGIVFRKTLARLIGGGVMRLYGPRAFRNAVADHCEKRSWDNPERYAHFAAIHTGLDESMTSRLAAAVDPAALQEQLASGDFFESSIHNDHFTVQQELFELARRSQGAAGSNHADPSVERVGYELVAFLVMDDLATTLRRYSSSVLKEKASAWTEHRKDLLSRICVSAEALQTHYIASTTNGVQTDSAVVVINSLHRGYVTDFRGRAELLATLEAEVANPQTGIIAVYGRGGIGKSLLAEKLFSNLRENGADKLTHIICFEPDADLADVYDQLSDLLPEEHQARLSRSYKRMISQERYDVLLRDFSRIAGDAGVSALLYFDEFERRLHSADSTGNERVTSDEGGKVVAMLAGSLKRHLDSVKVLITSRHAVTAFADSMPPVYVQHLLEAPLSPVETKELLCALDGSGELHLAAHSLDDFERFTRRIDGTPRCVRNAFCLLMANRTLSFRDVLDSDVLPRELLADVIDEKLAESLDPEAQRIRFTLALLQEWLGTPIPREVLSRACASEEGSFSRTLTQLRDWSLVSIKSTRAEASHETLCGMHALDRTSVVRHHGDTKDESFAQDRERIAACAAKAITGYIGSQAIEPESRRGCTLRKHRIELLLRTGELTGAVDELLELCEPLFAAGRYSEIVAICERFQGGGNLERQQEVELQNVSSKALNWSGQLNKALTFSNRAVGSCTGSDDPLLRSRAFALRADCFNELGQSWRALSDSTLAYRLAEDANSLPDMAFAVFHMARAHRALGDVTEAVRCFERSAALEEACDVKVEVTKRRKLGWIKRNLAQSYMQDGDSERAMALYLESIDIHREEENPGDLSLSLVRRARLTLNSLEPSDRAGIESVLRDCREALLLSEETTLLQTRVEARQTLALAMLAADEEIREIQKLLDELEEYDYVRFGQFTPMLWGLTLMRLGSRGEARVAFERAVMHSRQLLDTTPGYIYAVCCLLVSESCLAILATPEIGDSSTALEQLVAKAAESNLGQGLRAFVVRTLRLVHPLDEWGVVYRVERLLISTQPGDCFMASDQSLIAGFFTGCSNEYEKRIAPVFRDFADAVRAYACPSEFDVAVDLGTGTGVLARLLAPSVESVTGVDFSEAMISVARLACEEGDRGRMNFVVADVEDLPFADDSYSLVVSSFGLNALASDAVFAEAARVLRPGGRLVFQEWSSQYNHPFDVLVGELMQKHRAAGDPPASVLATRRAMQLMDRWGARFASAAHYEKALQETGFSRIEIEEDTSVSVTATIDDFLDYKLSWTQHAVELANMSADVRQACLSEIREGMLSHADEQGYVVYDPLLVRVKASVA